MEKLLAIIAIVVCSFASFNYVSAQEQKKEPLKIKFDGYCYSFSELVSIVTEYGELPMVRGNVATPERQSVFVFYINQQTRSWTFTEKVADQLYCIVASGGGLVPVPEEIVEEYRKLQPRPNL